MKIELKSIKHSESLSEETNAFTANVYINGVLAATARNDGHGGNTDVCPVNPSMKGILADAEKWCKSLPAEKLEVDDKVVDVEIDLECYVDTLLENYLKEKDKTAFERKIVNATKKHIVWGIPGSGAFRQVGWSGYTVEKLLSIPQGREAVKKTYDRIKSELKPGEEIFNKNLGTIK